MSEYLIKALPGGPTWGSRYQVVMLSDWVEGRGYSLSYHESFSNIEDAEREIENMKEQATKDMFTDRMNQLVNAICGRHYGPNGLRKIGAIKELRTIFENAGVKLGLKDGKDIIQMFEPSPAEMREMNPTYREDLSGSQRVRVRPREDEPYTSQSPDFRDNGLSLGDVLAAALDEASQMNRKLDASDTCTCDFCESRRERAHNAPF